MVVLAPTDSGALLTPFAPSLCAQMVMLLFVGSARQVDVQVARAQRRQLGLCEACGGVNEPGTCAQKGCPMMAAEKDKR